MPTGVVQNTGATGAVAGGQTLVFGGVDTILELDSPASVAGTIVGFGTGNTIDLAGVLPGSVSYAAGKLYFEIAGTRHSIAMPMGGTGSILTATDNARGTDVTTLCSCQGTRIATPQGEVPVQCQNRRAPPGARTVCPRADRRSDRRYRMAAPAGPRRRASRSAGDGRARPAPGG